MLFKKTIIASILLITTAVVLAQNPEIFEGYWSDGTKIEWVCPKGTQGTIPFRVTGTDGSQHIGKLNCGEPV